MSAPLGARVGKRPRRWTAMLQVSREGFLECQGSLPQGCAPRVKDGVRRTRRVNETEFNAKGFHLC